MLPLPWACSCTALIAAGAIACSGGREPQEDLLSWASYLEQGYKNHAFPLVSGDGKENPGVKTSTTAWLYSCSGVPIWPEPSVEVADSPSHPHRARQGLVVRDVFPGGLSPGLPGCSPQSFIGADRRLAENLLLPAQHSCRYNPACPPLGPAALKSKLAADGLNGLTERTLWLASVSEIAGATVKPLDWRLMSLDRNLPQLQAVCITSRPLKTQDWGSAVD
ncbi:hypothetical protein TREES_T100014938 [Tupaia chinensis]|uniref:Uncharacterized protein n=1 Tax=Tupaia chinensis TaxID=246437 RepID=L9KTQ4_TUPCH|nr:hypothetical protein TREES_T100014938 [Tupaia chinensis]